MRRNLVLSLVLLGVMGLARLATAQDNPAAKPKENPFEGAAKVEEAEKRPAGHVIKLSQPLGPEATLEERLEAKGTFHAEEVPLKEFSESLEEVLGTSVVLATKKLEEAAINLETPMYYRLRNVRLKTALRLILGDVGLTYVIHDNVLMITTPEDASSQLVTRVYDCRDLMKLPSPVRKVRYVREDLQCQPPKKVEEKPKEAPGPDGGYNMDDLVDVISSIVSPDSWDDVGGPGSISDFKGMVTISQTQEVHEQVENLLNMLHKTGGLEEKVKVSR